MVNEMTRSLFGAIERESRLAGHDDDGGVAVEEARDVAASMAHAYSIDNEPPCWALSKALSWLNSRTLSMPEKLPKQDPFTIGVYVITKNPSSHPGKIVVRRHVVTFGGGVTEDKEPFIIHTYLPSVRRQLSMTYDLHRLNWHPGENDDHGILEIWG